MPDSQTRDGRVPLWRTIPAGMLSMGSPFGEVGRFNNEGPRHEVINESAFRLAAVPVTQAQYTAFDPEHRSHHEGDRRPVDSVTRYQATAFCNWLASHKTTVGARLPSEEEWEYACRAGTTSRYWSGDADSDARRVAWFGEGPGGSTHPVGEKPANPWGLEGLGEAFNSPRNEATELQRRVMMQRNAGCDALWPNRPKGDYR